MKVIKTNPTTITDGETRDLPAARVNSERGRTAKARSLKGIKAQMLKYPIKDSAKIHYTLHLWGKSQKRVRSSSVTFLPSELKIKILSSMNFTLPPKINHIKHHSVRSAKLSQNYKKLKTKQIPAICKKQSFYLSIHWNDY